MAPRKRSRRWVSGAAAAAALATSLPAPDARAEVFVGGHVGLTFWPEVRLVYGVDVRSSYWWIPASGGWFARIEGHGLSHARIAGGISGSVSPFDSRVSLVGDLGLALSTPSLDGTRQGSLGLHLAGGLGDVTGGLMLDGSLPLSESLSEASVGAHLRLSTLLFHEVVDGRALRENGAIVLPEVLGVNGTEDDVVGGWLDAARGEAASVPAFDRLAVELRLAEAPEALARAAEIAAADEVRHANAALAEASRRAGRILSVEYPETRARFAGPGPEAMALLAVEAYVDGCIGEGAAALRAARSRADDAVTSELLRTVAREEAEHAALAWRILDWALAAGGDDVRDAVHTAARTARDQVSVRDADAFAARQGLTSPDVAAQAFEEVERDARRRLGLG